jgi:ribosomal protein S18 acetylase RimI-like enzyme
MNIRQATSEDALLLSGLCRDVQSLHAQKHTDIFKMPDSDDFAVSFFAEMLADPIVRVFIAEQNGEAVGYIFCKLIERAETPFTFAIRSLHVDQISVRPADRGGGVGRALMREVKLLAKELNVQRIQLDSWNFNVDAHAFFERVGFEKFMFRFWRHP